MSLWSLLFPRATEPNTRRFEAPRRLAAARRSSRRWRSSSRNSIGDWSVLMLGEYCYRSGAGPGLPSEGFWLTGSVIGRRRTSASWSAGMGVGAPVRGSAPDWVLGEVVTWRVGGGAGRRQK